MKYIYRRRDVQGNRLDTIKFDSSPFTSIPKQYGYHSIHLHEIEEKSTHLVKYYYVFAKLSAESKKEMRIGELEMLTSEGIRLRMLEYER